MKLLDGKSLKGILWTGAEKVLVSGVGFVQGVILARLLSPHDFGLTAMLGIFLAVGGVLAESGFGTALVADGGKYACFERRALRWNLGIAAAIYAVLFFAAPFIAGWYGIPLLSPLTRVMALGLGINAASVVATARLTREMRFKELAWVNSAPAIAAAALAIVLAWMGFGVWSIVALGLASAVIRTSLAWWMAGRRETGDTMNSPDLATAGSFAAFLVLGAKFSASSLIYTAYSNLYLLLIGKMFNPAAVGLFNRAQRWARLPVELSSGVVTRVAFPIISKTGDGLLRYILLDGIMIWPCLIVLWCFATPIVDFVLGPQWVECVPYLRIIVIGGIFSPLGDIANVAMLAAGNGNVLLAAEIVKRTVGISLVLTGCVFGIEGICWACVGNEAFTAVVDMVSVTYLKRKRANGNAGPHPLGETNLLQETGT